MSRPLTAIGWFVIGTLYGLKDRQADLHVGMTATLNRLAQLTEAAALAATRQPSARPSRADWPSARGAELIVSFENANRRRTPTCLSQRGQVLTVDDQARHDLGGVAGR